MEYGQGLSFAVVIIFTIVYGLSTSSFFAFSDAHAMLFLNTFSPTLKGFSNACTLHYFCCVACNFLICMWTSTSIDLLMCSIFLPWSSMVMDSPDRLGSMGFQTLWLFLSSIMNFYRWSSSLKSQSQPTRFLFCPYIREGIGWPWTLDDIGLTVLNEGYGFSVLMIVCLYIISALISFLGKCW